MLIPLFTITVVYQVLSRYIQGIPRVHWTEEFARGSLLWVVFLGAAFAFASDRHFTIEMLPGKMRPRFRAVIDLVATALIVTILVALLTGSVTNFEAGFGRVSPMSGVSLSLAYAALPVSFAIMLLQSVENFLKVIPRLSSNSSAHTEEVSA
ncbi:TRAP transporter small permease [Cryobacterium sp. Hh7]|uniref:TRAP transporter small permease n=1 Tax=Cryobacterium sp. Hh7 TaxID=1259159 RepID=UPI00141AB761|nr:TRAP transporter small permease [Cryobacterium sp. Hh7]